MILVPTLCVGTHVRPLCGPSLYRLSTECDAERRQRAFPRRAWERGKWKAEYEREKDVCGWRGGGKY